MNSKTIKLSLDEEALYHRRVSSKSQGCGKNQYSGTEPRNRNIEQLEGTAMTTQETQPLNAMYWDGTVTSARKIMRWADSGTNWEPVQLTHKNGYPVLLLGGIGVDDNLEAHPHTWIVWANDGYRFYALSPEEFQRATKQTWLDIKRLV